MTYSCVTEHHVAITPLSIDSVNIMSIDDFIRVLLNIYNNQYSYTVNCCMLINYIIVPLIINNKICDEKYLFLTTLQNALTNNNLIVHFESLLNSVKKLINDDIDQDVIVGNGNLTKSTMAI